MTDITHLIERLEAATEGSRELDAAVLAAVYPDTEPMYNHPDGKWWWFVDPVTRLSEVMPSPTTSLDYITADIDSHLPEFCWQVHAGGYGEVFVPGVKGRSYHGDAKTAALALCAARLRAYQTQEHANG